MSKPNYTPAELARAHERYFALCNAVGTCQLQSVRDLWASACENGVDSTDDTNVAEMRRYMNMPDLTAMDVEIIITLSSACGLTTERTAGYRARQWFRNRGIVG